MSFNIKYIYEAVDKFSGVADRINAKIDSTRYKLLEANAAATKWGKSVKAAGKKLSMFVSLPAAGFLGSAIKSSYEFEVQLNSVKAVTGATAAQFEQMRKQALDLGLTTKFSATQVAEAQVLLGQAGYNTDQILQAVPATLNLAAAGGLDMARATDIVANVMHGFNLQVSDTARIADVLAVAAAKTNTEVGELGYAMTYAAPVASQFGLSLEDATAAMGILSNAGMKGSMAGTGLRNVLTKLVSPSRELKRFMGGKTIAKDGLAAVLDQVAQAGLTAADAMKIFGLRGGPAYLNLVNQRQGLKDLANTLKNAGGAAQAMAHIKLEGMVGAFRFLAASWDTLKKTLVDETIQKQISYVVGALHDLFTAIGQSSPWVRHMIFYLLVFASVIGPLVIAIGVLAMSFGPLQKGLFFLGTGISWLSTIVKYATLAFAWLGEALMFLFANPVGIAILAIVALVAGLVFAYKHFQAFRNAVNAVCVVLASAFNGLVNIWRDFVGWLEKGLEILHNFSPSAVGAKIKGWVAEHTHDVNINASGVAAGETHSTTKADVNVNINDPGKNVKSIEAKKTGNANLNVGHNMKEAY